VHYEHIFFLFRYRDSSVGIALGYGLDDRGSRVRFPTRAGNFSLHHCVQNGSGAHPVSYPMGTGGSFLGVKRPGREADHSPSSSAEVKNAWSYTSTPLGCLRGVVLSEAQGQLYLLPYRKRDGWDISECDFSFFVISSWEAWPFTPFRYIYRYQVYHSLDEWRHVTYRSSTPQAVHYLICLISLTSFLCVSVPYKSIRFQSDCCDCLIKLNARTDILFMHRYSFIFIVKFSLICHIFKVLYIWR
jgi:hypothetical protein